MPKGKLRAGMEPARIASATEEKESLFRRYEREFRLGTLSRDILERLTNERQVEYLNIHYQRRFKRKILWTKESYTVCQHCLVSAYYDDGYISDRQVRFLSGKKEPDLESLDHSYPGLSADVYSINGLSTTE